MATQMSAATPDHSASNVSDREASLAEGGNETPPVEEIPELPREQPVPQPEANDGLEGGASNANADDAAVVKAEGPRRRFPLYGLAAVGLLLVVPAVGFLVGGESRPPEFAGRLAGLPGPLTTVAYSHDGNRLAAGNALGAISVWKLESETRGEQIAQFPSQSDASAAAPIVALALSPDGYLIAADSNRNLVGWQMGSAEPQEIPRLKATVTCIALRPGTKGAIPQAVLGMKNGTIAFLREDQAETEAAGHTGYSKTAAYDPSGRWLVTGGTDGRVIWRHAESRKILQTTQPHTSEVAALVFSHDGGLLATGDWDGRICLWNTQSREIIAELNQPDAVSGIGFLSDGPALVSGSWDGFLRFWTMKDFTLTQAVDTGRPIHALAASPSGQTVATVSDRNQVDLWQLD